MMRSRSIKVIAIILGFIVAFAVVLGWDLVYEQQVTEKFFAPSQPSDNL